MTIAITGATGSLGRLVIDELLWLTTGLQVVPFLDPKTTPPINQVRIIDTVLDRIRNLNRRPAVVPTGL